MPKEPIKKFIDTMDLPEPPKPDRKVWGKEVLQQVWAIRVGAGTSVFNADISGIWLGAKAFASAPFRVDMEGSVTASSMTITGGTITGVSISEYLALTGGTLTGELILDADPTEELGAATKQYVDDTAEAILPSIVFNNDEIISNNDEVVYI